LSDPGPNILDVNETITTRAPDATYSVLARTASMCCLDLADEVGWSRRHLIARFRQQVGLPPKTLSRIVRFAGLARRLEAPDRPGLARLATEAGYYDQTHLNREFREFTGTTPTSFSARQRGGIEVTSVQDGGRSAA